jgi:AAA+ ATPase superfamily predicted ATPase
MLEIENYDSLKTIITRDYETFSGLMLERYFKRILIESREYTRIGSWWDRKGENEIDILAEDELEKKIEFIEVKRQEKNFDEAVLRAKSELFFKAVGTFKSYEFIYRGLSIDDM